MTNDATLATYCKAVPAKTLSAFPQWQTASDAVSAHARENTIFYLHSDLKVRTGIATTDTVVFFSDGDAWSEFCRTNLGFEPPAFAASKSIQGANDYG